MNRWRIGVSRSILALCLANSISLPMAFAAEPRPSTPIILISIDTLRADHLSAYGYAAIRTPQIDSFAEPGTIFTAIQAQIPLTLPSHASLFTSTYPFTNGIEENGERVPAGAVTLASVLQAHGYQTAAFIGSAFLDRRFGLDQGFQEYDTPFHEQEGLLRDPYTFAVRRDGNLVTSAALEWLNAHRGQPVFIFVHLFDLHTPYSLPESAARKHGISRYDAQLEYVDGVLGRFRQALIKEGWWQKSLVVLLADHGEGLGEHGEFTHGYFIYQSTLWVPLMFHWPEGRTNFPARMGQPAGLIDVAPTILDFLHLPEPRSFEGSSLMTMLRPGGSGGQHPVYSESVYAHDAFRWASLRGLRLGAQQYIAAPRPELYNLQKDQKEKLNLIQSNSALAHSMHQELARLLAKYAPTRPAPPAVMSHETRELLESLSYLSPDSGSDPDSTGPDPKDRLPEYHLYKKALASMYLGRPASAIPALREILSRDPGNTLARYHLGECFLQLHRPEDALREWSATLARDPGYSPAAISLGEYWMDKQDYSKARACFQQAVVATRDDYKAEFDLGIAEEHLGLLKDALAHLQMACRIGPELTRCSRELKAVEEKTK